MKMIILSGNHVKNNESIDTKILKVNNLVTSVDNKIIMIKKLSLNLNEIKEKPNHLIMR